MFILFFIFISYVYGKDIYIRDYGIINNNNSDYASIVNEQSFRSALNDANYSDNVILDSNETIYYLPNIEYPYFNNLSDIIINIDGKIILNNNIDIWPMYDSSKFYNAIDIRYSKNITITGKGYIDGKGYEWWYNFLIGNIPRQRPTIIQFYNSIDITIENISLFNSPRFHIYGDNMLNFIARNLYIWVDILQQRHLKKSIPFPIFPFNTDGIDFSGKNVHINNITISNYDDSVCVKPLNNKSESLNNKIMNCSQDILIENINIKYGVGISIGSVVPKNNRCIQNVIFKNVNAINPIKLIYIKTGSNENANQVEAKIKNITYQNITAHNPILYPIYIGPQQQKEPDGTGDGIRPNTNPYVNISDILLHNINISGLKGYAGLLRCNISNPCRNIRFNNVVMEGIIPTKHYICDGRKTIYGSYQKTSPNPYCIEKNII